MPTPPAGTVRALHLFGTAPDYQTERASGALAEKMGPGFEISTCAIGPGGRFRNVASAALGLRRMARGVDLIHAWDEAAFAAAAVAGVGPILFSPPRPLGRRAVGWVRAVLNYRDVRLVLPAATERRRCVERGIPPDRCLVIRPGVDFSRVRRRRDPDLRRALGLADADHVLLAPGESTEPADHERAVWAGSILGVIDPKYKILLWGRGPRARRAAALGGRLRQPDLVRVAEARLGRRIGFEELLSAADTTLVAAREGAATLPVAACMAAGLPIVSTVSYTLGELLEDRHSAVMAPPGSPRHLARRFLDLQADPALRWAVADTAKAEAFEYFPLTRFLDEYRALYRGEKKC